MTTIAERGHLPEILLIEDNPDDALLLRIAFKTACRPANITVAPTAEAVMGVLQHKAGYPPYARPDLILLDLNLPRMQGLTLLNKIKGDPELSTIPTIVFSNSENEKDIAECYANHADGFMSKPESLDAYSTLVDSIGDYWFNQVQTPKPARSAVEELSSRLPA